VTDGITAMWDDAKHYEELAEYYNVPVQCNGMWPYYMDTKHYEELKARYVGEERMKTPDYEKIREEIHEKHSESFKALYISELKDQIADKDEVITAQDHIIAEQKSEVEKYKTWFEMKSESNAKSLANLTKANLRIEQIEERIDNATMAATETQPSWKHRCYSIMAALGVDCGDPDWLMPDERKKLAEAEAEIERLRKALVYSDEHAAKIEKMLWESLQEHIKLIEEKK
jgi:hypothetical protein